MVYLKVFNLPERADSVRNKFENSTNGSKKCTDLFLLKNGKILGSKRMASKHASVFLGIHLISCGSSPHLHPLGSFHLGCQA